MRKLIKYTWLAFVLAAPLTLATMLNKHYPFTLAEIANCYVKWLTVYLGASAMGVLLGMYTVWRYKLGRNCGSDTETDPEGKEGAGA